MIDFTSENFNIDYFKKIKKQIKNATFISLDNEFTSVSEINKIKYYDS